jgi:septal ring factor EnvC (AmiA/AmiB activator)
LAPRQVQKLQVQLQQAHAERDDATAQAAAAKSEASALQQQLQEAAQQLADARLQLSEAAESRDALQHQLHSLQAALQDMASDKDAAFTRLGKSAWLHVCQRVASCPCTCNKVPAQPSCLPATCQLSPLFVICVEDVRFQL